jgi:hypothetical protein
LERTKAVRNSFHRRLSRRALLTAIACAGGGAALLAACGGGVAVTTGTSASGATSAAAPAAPAVTSSGTSAAPTTAPATTSSVASTSTAVSAAATATTSSVETSYVANANKAGATVTVLDGWGTGPWEKQLYDGWTQGIAKALPDLKVEFIMTGDYAGGSAAKTLAMIAASTPPDLTLGSDVSFAVKGALVDLKTYFDQDKDINGWKWYPPCWQLVNIVSNDGHPMLWAFPGNSDARVIYVNLDLLQKEGITLDPTQHWDWPTFEDAAKRLTKRHADGTIQQLGFTGLWTFGDPYVLAQYAGGGYFELDKASGWATKATFGASGTQQGLDFFRKLMVEDKVGLLPNEKFTGNFTAGTVAMQPSWTSFLSSLNPVTNPKLQQFKWDVVGYPVQKAGDKWPNQFANGSQMGSLVKGAKSLDGAFAVGKYLIGDGHAVRMQAMGAPPIVINNAQQQQIWKQRAPSTRYTDTYATLMSQGSIGTWSKIKSNSDQIMKLYNDNITKLLQGQMAVSDFGAAMDGSVNPLLQSS